MCVDMWGLTVQDWMDVCGYVRSDCIHKYMVTQCTMYTYTHMYVRTYILAYIKLCVVPTSPAPSFIGCTLHKTRQRSWGMWWSCWD